MGLARAVALRPMTGEVAAMVEFLARCVLSKHEADVGAAITTAATAVFTAFMIWVVCYLHRMDREDAKLRDEARETPERHNDAG